MRGTTAKIVAAFLLGVFVASGPQIAIAAYDATNSDKVDGKHAVGATASVADRAGRLVATNSNGVLPNNIIVKAPNADRLDGLDGTQYQRRLEDSCSENQKLIAAGQDGSLVCATDAISGGNAQTLDALDSDDFEREPTRTVVLGPVGTAAENGAVLLAALARIPTSGTTAPAVGNRWLLKLEPGTYTLTSRLAMRPNVDIEGSGPATIISCSCGGSATAGSATVTTANQAELRSVQVRNTSTGAPIAIGI